MQTADWKQTIQEQLDAIGASGLYKAERVITSPQDVHIRVDEDR